MNGLPDHLLTVAGVVDLIIVGTLLEGLVLAGLYWRTRRGLSPREAAGMLGAGLCLMLALRFSMADAHAAWVTALLAASGVAHFVDLRLRKPAGHPSGGERGRA